MDNNEPKDKVSLPGGADDSERTILEVLNGSIVNGDRTTIITEEKEDEDTKDSSSLVNVETKPSQTNAILDIESHLIETYENYSISEDSECGGISIDELPPAKEELAKPSLAESETSPKTVVEIEPAVPRILKTVETVVDTQSPQIAAESNQESIEESSHIENGRSLSDTQNCDTVIDRVEFRESSKTESEDLIDEEEKETADIKDTENGIATETITTTTATKDQISIDINGLPLPSTPLEEEEKRRFLDSIPQLEATDDSIAVSRRAKKEYYQSLRKYLVDEHDNKPPIPLQTYRWEDLRRAKERGGYPWTHLCKRPLGPNEEPEIVLLLRKSQEFRFTSESPRSLKKVRIDETVLVKETERYIHDLEEDEEEEDEDDEESVVDEADARSVQSEAISCASDTVLTTKKKSKLDKLRGILKSSKGKNKPSNGHVVEVENDLNSDTRSVQSEAVSEAALSTKKSSRFGNLQGILKRSNGKSIDDSEDSRSVQSENVSTPKKTSRLEKLQGILKGSKSSKSNEIVSLQDTTSNESGVHIAEDSDLTTATESDNHSIKSEKSEKKSSKLGKLQGILKIRKNKEEFSEPEVKTTNTEEEEAETPYDAETQSLQSEAISSISESTQSGKSSSKLGKLQGLLKLGKSKETTDSGREEDSTGFTADEADSQSLSESTHSVKSSSKLEKLQRLLKLGKDKDKDSADSGREDDSTAITSDEAEDNHSLSESTHSAKSSSELGKLQGLLKFGKDKTSADIGKEEDNSALKTDEAGEDKEKNLADSGREDDSTAITSEEVESRGVSESSEHVKSLSKLGKLQSLLKFGKDNEGDSSALKIDEAGSDKDKGLANIAKEEDNSALKTSEDNQSLSESIHSAKSSSKLGKLQGLLGFGKNKDSAVNGKEEYNSVSQTDEADSISVSESLKSSKLGKLQGLLKLGKDKDSAIHVRVEENSTVVISDEADSKSLSESTRSAKTSSKLEKLQGLLKFGKDKEKDSADSGREDADEAEPVKPSSKLGKLQGILKRGKNKDISPAPESNDDEEEEEDDTALTVDEAETQSVRSEAISSVSDTAKKTSKLGKLQGILKLSKNKPKEAVPSAEESTSTEPKETAADSPKEEKCCHPIMDKLKIMAGKHMKKSQIKNIPLEKDEKIVLEEEQKIIRLKTSPKAQRGEIPHFIEKQDSDDILDIVELEESPSQKRKDHVDEESSIVVADEIIELPPQQVELSQPSEEVTTQEDPKSSPAPPRKSPRLRREHVYEDIEDDVDVPEIIEMISVDALKKSLAAQDDAVVKDLDANRAIPLDRMGSSEEEVVHAPMSHLAPLSSIDSASSEDEKRVQLSPVAEESDAASVDAILSDKESADVIHNIEEHEKDELLHVAEPELKPSLKREASPSPSEKKVTFSHIEDEAEPHREDVELPEDVRENAPNRWSNMT